MKANLSPNLALKLAGNENYFTEELIGISLTEFKLFLLNGRKVRSVLDRVLDEDLDLECQRLPIFLAGGCSGMANSSPTLGLFAGGAASLVVGALAGTTATRLGSDTEEVATTTLCGVGIG